MTRRTPRRPGARPPGRPTKLTPAVRDAIVNALEAGHFLDTAAAHVGVARATVYAWLQAGQGDDAPPEYLDFLDAVTRARARAEDVLVSAAMLSARGGAVVKRTHRVDPNGGEVDEEQVAPPDGKVALELLARMYPARWTARKALDVSVTDEAGVGAGVESGRFAELAGELRSRFERRQVESSRVPVVDGAPVVDAVLEPEG